MAPLPSLVSWVKRRILGDERERWDHQYATGRWEYLKGAAERARLEACATALRRHVPAAHVLELGCGEALLQQQLAPSDYASWLGVDLSPVAIARAQHFAGPQVQYRVADMRYLQTQGTYTAIVFPESIYYVTQRDALLRRYASLLQPGGVFIISIFTTKRSPKVWEEIHSVAQPIDSSVTTNELGSWVCEVLRMR